MAKPTGPPGSSQLSRVQKPPTPPWAFLPSTTVLPSVCECCSRAKQLFVIGQAPARKGRWEPVPAAGLRAPQGV